MVSIYKRRRKDGTCVYHMSYYVNGRHTTETTRTSDKQLARKIAAQKEKEIALIEQGLEPEEKIEPILLSEFIDVYLEERRRLGKAHRTITTDEYALRRLMDYTGDCVLASITESAVQNYRNHKLQKIKSTSVAIELRTLKAAFSWAVEKPGRKYLRKNPFKQKGLIPSPEKPKTPPCLSPEEKRQFLDAIDDSEHKLLFQFFLLSGCRRSEVVRLDWSDIDLEEKQITFRKTKSGRDHVIPVSIELWQIIHDLDRTKPKPFPYHGDWISHLFRRYLKKAGIEKPLSLHSTRHTCGTDLTRSGFHLVQIKDFLGHSSTKVTEIYCHSLSQDLKDLAESLTCAG